MDLQKIKQALFKLDKKKQIQFIILFGSVAEGRQTPLSDIDIAVYYRGSEEERFKFRVTALGNLQDKIDLQIFQDLPLTVKKEVIGGKILFYRDYQFLFDEVMKVIKEYEFFERYRNQYYAAYEGEALES
ncbi:nucleotidyltransferase domain-containing protein [Candidatus Woesearchaeota archaeon]|nr:nucleotidyltransferase domain-containing protein [Candidatus Woesearchaeota archaeon]